MVNSANRERGIFHGWIRRILKLITLEFMCIHCSYKSISHLILYIPNTIQAYITYFDSAF